MPEKTWLETRKKRTRSYVFVFLVLAVAAVAVFIRNNREMFLSKSGVTKQGTVFSPADTAKETPGPRYEKTALDADMQNAKKLPATPAMAPTASSVLLPDIQCALRNRGALKVVLSMELFMADDSFKREVLSKRENLKIMVKKVLAAKTLDELVVDSLRSQTKTAMNKLMGKNMITDVEFRDFRIDKAQ